MQLGQIRDCNRSLLAAAASQAGAQVSDLGILRDTLGSVEAGLQKAIDIGGPCRLPPAAW
jgi:molybdopterin biosynthesis enzyme